MVGRNLGICEAERKGRGVLGEKFRLYNWYWRARGGKRKGSNVNKIRVDNEHCRKKNLFKVGMGQIEDWRREVCVWVLVSIFQRVRKGRVKEQIFTYKWKWKDSGHRVNSKSMRSYNFKMVMTIEWLRYMQCAERDYVSGSTIFRKERIHNYTWASKIPED